MAIELGKKYRTRDGSPARVICVDRKAPRPVVALVGVFENVYAYDSNGRREENETEHYSDLIEVKPYEDFKIDEPVMVRNGAVWHRRHFAGVDANGMALVFHDGCTSWTGDGVAVIWCECRRPTPEELGS